jgi:hypothetical protein
VLGQKRRNAWHFMFSNGLKQKSRPWLRPYWRPNNKSAYVKNVIIFPPIHYVAFVPISIAIAKLYALS